MAALNAFWSYVHLDNEAEKNRIKVLAEDIVLEFELRTGEKVSSFFYDGIIPWGENWRERIDENLNNLFFIIPILTPRFFQSQECRNELDYFIKRAKVNNLTGIILPILFAKVQEFSDQEPSDPLIAELKYLQWEDWTKLRLKDVGSEAYRCGVAELVTKLIEKNKKLEETFEKNLIQPTPEETKSLDDNFDEDKPGLIDCLADVQDNLEPATLIINEFQVELSQLSELMNSEKIKAGSNTRVSQTVQYARRVANKITPVVDNIIELGKKYNEHIVIVDDRINAIFDYIEFQLSSKHQVDKNVISFLESIAKNTSVFTTAKQALDEAIGTLEPLIAFSRDLRPVLRKLTMGLKVFSTSLGNTVYWCEKATNYLTTMNSLIEGG